MSTLTVKAIEAPVGYDLQMPAGHVVQVVEAVLSTGASIVTTSQTYVATGLSASITPKQTGSKIIATASGFCPHVNPGASNKGLRLATYSQVASGGYSNIDGTRATASFFLNAGGWLDGMGTIQSMFTPSYSAGQQIDVSIYILYKFMFPGICFFFPEL